jgi:hypothetical protein
MKTVVMFLSPIVVDRGEHCTKPKALAATIGVVEIKQFALGTAFEEVADAIAAVVRENRAKVVVDSSNNSAFVGTLAVRLPQPPANWLVAAAITSALAHSAQPTPFAVTLGGQTTSVPRWTLSKSELVETVAAELGNGSLRFAKQGDWEALQDELAASSRRRTRSPTRRS